MYYDTIKPELRKCVAATFRLHEFKQLLNYPFYDLKRRLKPAATRFYNDPFRNSGLIISILFFYIAIIMLTACTGGSSDDAASNNPKIGNAMVFPGSDWEIRTPESQGVDSAKLNKAMNYLGSNAGGVGVSEAVVIRNGYMIWKGSDIDNYHVIFSATKTFTITVLGLLIQDGLISSIDARAVNYLPSLDDTYPQYADITFRHLASMTSGYDGINGDRWHLYQQKLYDQYDKCVLTYTTPGQPLFSPGISFKYHDPAVHMLGYILTKVSGRSLENIFKERIADPIGITNWDWPDYGTRKGLNGIIFNNPAGTPGTNQGGIYISARQMARYGYLYLNRGNWNGKQLLDASWVDQATTNQVSNSLRASGFDRRGRYGFMWWTNGIGPDGNRPWPSAPPKTYTSHGGSRNFCFVIPEWNMVIVRMDNTEGMDMKKEDQIWDNFFKILKRGIS